MDLEMNKDNISRAGRKQMCWVCQMWLTILKKKKVRNWVISDRRTKILFGRMLFYYYYYYFQFLR